MCVCVRALYERACASFVCVPKKKKGVQLRLMLMDQKVNEKEAVVVVASWTAKREKK